ncbi:MAG: hypothetical protein Q7J82_06370 [Coriobacteriia bacterium]|nr:hypothetical protein [Coriobacteriia bacterium]
MPKLTRCLLALVMISFAAGCAPSQAEPAVVDDAVLEKAVDVIDCADTFTEQVNSGSSAMLVSLDRVDREIERFEKADGPAQMPSFYEAITSWRAGLDEAMAADAGVMTDRALDDMSVAYGAARSALNAALDSAGK